MVFTVLPIEVAETNFLDSDSAACSTVAVRRNIFVQTTKRRICLSTVYNKLQAKSVACVVLQT